MSKILVPINKISLTIPQVYDESLTYYEALSKIVYILENLPNYIYMKDSYDADTYTVSFESTEDLNGKVKEK